MILLLCPWQLYFWTLKNPLIIFASGTGTNAGAIIEHFKNNGKAKVALIVSNNANAGALDIARREDIPFLVISRQTFREMLLVEQLSDYKPSLVILAGFMWKIPEKIVHTFPGRIINIHPALLPDYGGKGMYGQHVHQAVIAAKEHESGITIHYVNEHYDKGDIILQARCPVNENDTPGELAGRIHKLEHFYYPRAIEFLLENMG